MTCSPVSDGMADIFKLSRELLDLIIGYITRPTDLRRLRLTCKQFESVATPVLFRTVEIDISNERSFTTIVKSFTSAGHCKLQYVRNLILHDGRWPIPGERHATLDEQAHDPFESRNRLDKRKTVQAEDQLILMMKTILKTIPDLRLFCFDGWMNMDDILPHLPKSLQHLHIPLEFRSSSRHIQPRANLESLDITFYDPTNRKDLVEKAVLALSHSPNLKTLCLASTSPDSGLFAGLFADTKKVSVTNLTRIELIGMDLHEATTILPHALNLKRMRVLRIWNCNNAHKFLEATVALMEQAGSRLKTFAFSMVKPVTQDEFKGTEEHLNRLLTRFNHRLEELHLRNLYHIGSPKMIEAISKLSLRVLALDFAQMDNSRTYVNAQPFAYLSHRLRNLDQLSIVFPPHKISRASFTQEWTDLMKLFRNFRDLKMLCIDHHFERSSTAQGQLEQESGLTEFATFFWNHYSQFLPKLKVLALGSKVSRTGDEAHPHPAMYFSRGTQTNSFGESTKVAIPISKRMVKYIHPATGIIDYDPWQRCNPKERRPTAGLLGV